jgi:hypothetical protein
MIQVVLLTNGLSAESGGGIKVVGHGLPQARAWLGAANNPWKDQYRLKVVGLMGGGW